MEALSFLRSVVSSLGVSGSQQGYVNFRLSEGLEIFCVTKNLCDVFKVSLGAERIPAVIFKAEP